MRDSSQKCPNGYLYHLIGTPHLPWNKSETAHAPAEGFLLNRSTQKIWNAKDFGIACIGRQFPYKEEGPSNLLKLSSNFCAICWWKSRRLAGERRW